MTIAPAGQPHGVAAELEQLAGGLTSLDERVERLRTALRGVDVAGAGPTPVPDALAEAVHRLDGALGRLAAESADAAVVVRGFVLDDPAGAAPSPGGTA